MHMVLRRNNVNVSGAGSRAMMFSHGFGCDQNMWNAVARAFEADFRVILFDHVGAGRSDLTAYQATKYAKLDGYADDVVEIGRALELKDAVFVGHSVSAMIGALASLKAPGMFSDLVMVGPSPRYVDEGDYIGGFSHDQVEELLEFLAQPPRLVRGNGAGDHGQPRSAGTRRDASQQLLRHRSRNRAPVRARDLLVRQQGRPASPQYAHARPAVP
jgi:pimeloyl-ACP methyl ester carboxylesterase